MGKRADGEAFYVHAACIDGAPRRAKDWIVWRPKRLLPKF